MQKLYDKFYYNGFTSDDMRVLSVTFQNDLKESFMAERTINEVKTAYNETPYFQGIQHNPLQFELELWFDINYPEMITDDEIRKIRRWLNPSEYKPFYYLEKPDEIFYCLPVSTSELTYNNIKQGYIKLLMRCKTYYKETPTYQTLIYDCSNNKNDDKEIVLENKGDLDILPNIWIRKVGNGGLSIINTSNSGQTLEFTEPKKAKGNLKFNGSLFDEELIKIGDKVYEIDTGDGVINSHINKWESEMLYYNGTFVNIDGVIYECIKNNNDKTFNKNNWKKLDESNIKVDCSLDASPAKAKLKFNDEAIKDGDTITIWNKTYEFDINEIYNSSNGNIPIDIKNYTTKATGVLECKNNEDFANSIIRIGDIQYSIMPTSTESQIIIDETMDSWDKFQLDYDYMDKAKLSKIILLLNEKRDNSINGLRLPYLNESNNRKSLTNKNRFELHKINKLTNIPSLGYADTGKFQPEIAPIEGQTYGDKLSIFKRTCCNINFDNASSTKSRIVVAKGIPGQLAQGGVYNEDLKANAGDFIFICRRSTLLPSQAQCVEYNGIEYKSGDFEILRIKEAGETNNGIMINHHRYGTAWFELQTPSKLFVPNGMGIHGKGKIVYGTGIDLANAKTYLVPFDYSFVDTSKMSEEDMKNSITPNDIIVGEKLTKGGVPFDIDGVLRLGGKNRIDTERSIRNYSIDIKNQYSTTDEFYMLLFRKQQKQITILGNDIFTEPYQIKQGVTLHETCNNIEKAINETGVEWVNYSPGTFQNEEVEAKYDKSKNEITLTATEYGEDSNEIITIVDDWDKSQKNISNSESINQFINKTLTGGKNPTWSSEYKNIKLINVVKDEMIKNQKDELKFDVNFNKINIECNKYGTIGNLTQVISNCDACEFENYDGEFTVTLDGGKDPSIETCINKLVEIIKKNNIDVDVEKDLENKQIKITYKETGKNGNINVDSSCMNAYWDCNKKLIGGKDGLVDEEEIVILQEMGEIISDKNINVIDNFNFEELVLNYGVNRLKIKGNCYLQFNIKYKLL